MSISERTLKARARAKAWALANPELYKQNQARYRAANKEKAAAYAKQYRQISNDVIEAKKAERGTEAYLLTMAEKAAKDKKAYQKANRDHLNAIRKAYWLEHPDLYQAMYTAGNEARRIRLLAIGGTLPEKLRQEIWAIGKCAVCGATDRKIEVDHIVPVCKGGTHDRANLQPLCTPCNKSKGTRDFGEWLLELQETV